ncbi:trypsin-like serine protease [Streptomyces virginiae]|uniref:trypsin-like serine protease n=1 Tax=Streptomyces virginiae TaxID=1961 RepID=UPI003869CBE8|nr:trypsin-like serine protease [Streptomyces virginiae]
MRIRRWIPVSTTALAVVLGTPTTLAAAGEPTDGMPYAIEDGAYPDRADVLGLTGADLIAGDGNITLTSCSGPYQIKVWAVKLKTDESRMCFTAANTGYLKVNIPRAYRIETVGRDVKAGISIAGTTESLTVGRDTSKGFGEADLSDPKQAVLLEMLVTGSSSPAPQGPTEGNPLSFTGKLKIGDTRACTAALIDPRWVVTAKSCFADNPAENNTIPAGAPKAKTVLTLGRADLTSTGGHTTDIVELVPHADRDLVLARLAAPATNVPPVALSAAAPTAGQDLTLAGYGRTSDEWVPSKLHSATYTTGTANAAGFDIAAKAPADASLCKGDAGAPVLRTENGRPTLAALASRSWQTNCHGSTETKTGAHTTRTDDLRQWVGQITAPRTGNQVSLLAGGGGVSWSQSGDLGYGEYGASWGKVDGLDVSKVSTVRHGDAVRAYAVAGGRVYSHDLDLATGKWSPWGEVPGGAAGAKDISAALVGDTVHVLIVGGDGNLYSQAADYKAGRWNDAWTSVGAIGLTHITSAASGTTVRVQGIGGGEVYGRDFDTRTGNWTAWGAIPGGAGGAVDITSSVVGNNVHVQIIGSDGAIWTQLGNYDAGRWNDAWAKVGGAGLTRISSVASGSTVELYAVGPDGKINNASMNTATGGWSAFKELRGGLAGASDISASAAVAPSKVTLAAGADNTLFAQNGKLATGAFGAQWVNIGGIPITRLTGVDTGSGIRYVGVASGRVYDREYNVTTNTWGNWNEVPGGAGGVKDVSAAMINNVLYVQALGVNGDLYIQVGDYNAGRWNTYWTPVTGMTGMTDISSAKAGSYVRLYGIQGGKVYGRDLDTRTGNWTAWGELPGKMTGAKDLAVSTTGHLVHVQVIGADGVLHIQTGDYNAGAWKDNWTKIGGTGLTRITSATAANNVHVYAISAGGKVQNTTLDTRTGTSTGWRDIPGTLTGPADLTATTTK